MRKYLIEVILSKKILIYSLIFLLTIFIIFQFEVANAIEKDKLMHLGAGAGIYVSMAAVEEMDVYKFENKLLLVFLAGASKEIHDSLYKEHTASFADIMATVAGGMVVYSFEWR
ncbi:MAG: hypothetical protein ACOCRO_08530 [Halanaerobiales bacterium]